MLALLWLISYLLSGILIIRCLLPQKRPVIRWWLGFSLGTLMMMWLPALCAFAVSFSAGAHWLSLIPLFFLDGIAFCFRNHAPIKPFSEDDRQSIRLLCWLALPLTLLSAFLIYTHDLRPELDGSYHTGQACYGDLSLHLSIITSLRNADFPADYAIMPGNRLSYPFLTDSFTTSFMLGGFTLQGALIISSVIMLALVFTGYCMLCQRLCKTKSGMFFAVLLFFLNGGLGFVYIFDMANVPLGVYNGRGELIRNSIQAETGIGNRLFSILEGESWYMTPTNHKEFDTYNLRWSNVIADMLIPQRTTMGGWSMLIPCLWLLTDLLLDAGKQLTSDIECSYSDSAMNSGSIHQIILLGIMAGGLPMIHTHSFAALAFCSFGMLLYSLRMIIKKRAWNCFIYWGLYAAITAILAVPQLFLWTFSQAFKTTEGTGSFIVFSFNWVNRYGDGLKDNYFWFYLKNIGLPYLLILLALFEKNQRFRLLLSGAFVIYILAEFIRFQPNEYDNNKLFYVWYMLCAPVAADYAAGLWQKLKGVRARPILTLLCLIICFLSGSISIAHECVSDWQLYSSEDVETAEFIEKNLPEHTVFLTGRQHLNPVSSLAGRTIVCGPDIWLTYHGLDTGQRESDIADFYSDPEGNIDVLQKYDVSYILVSGWERSDYSVNESALERLYPVLYESKYGSLIIYQVKGNQNDAS